MFSLAQAKKGKWKLELFRSKVDLSSYKSIEVAKSEKSTEVNEV